MLGAGNTVLPRFDRYARFLEACGIEHLTYSDRHLVHAGTPNSRGRLQAEYTLSQLRPGA
jgi:hypothetical protein